MSALTTLILTVLVSVVALWRCTVSGRCGITTESCGGRVAVGVGVLVRVGVGVFVAVLVGMFVGVSVGVFVGAGGSVAVGDGVALITRLSISHCTPLPA